MSDKLILATPYGGVTPEWVDANDDAGVDGEEVVSIVNAAIASGEIEAGSDIVPNPETTEDSPRLSSVGIDGTSYVVGPSREDITYVVNDSIRNGEIEAGSDIVPNPETTEDSPILSSIGIDGTDYAVRMPFDGIINAVNRGITMGFIPSREVVVPFLELKDLMEALASDEMTPVDRYPVGTPEKTTKFTTDMTYDQFETFLKTASNKSVVKKIFSLGEYADGTAYGSETGRYWNVYINYDFYEPRNGGAGGIAIEYDAESESGDIRVSPVEFKHKYVTLSVLVYGKELVPNFPDEEM